MSNGIIPKPELELTRETEESIQLFLSSNTFGDVATVLEVHPGHLKRWLYVTPGHKGYTRFEIPKKTGGTRLISKPPKSIGILQKKFKGILEGVYQPKPCVFGFVRGRSIVDGARRHKKKARWILNIDLEDYYPAINFGRVLGLFKSLGIGPKAAAVWAHLATHDGALPQGACTSPVLSNMIAQQLDNKMISLARRFHLTYTRFADDISLSTTEFSFPSEIAVRSGTGLDYSNVNLQPQLINTIRSCGFAINSKKTRLYSKFVRQEVTGLTVNDFVNVRRSYIRQIRAMIHAAETHGLNAAGEEHIERYASPAVTILLNNDDDKFDPAIYYLNVLYGKLAFLRMVRGNDDKCYVNLCLKMTDIDPNPPRQITKVKEMHEHFDVFICHASEDKESIALPLHEALIKRDIVAFIDNKYAKWGDSFVEIINGALSQSKLVVVVLSENSVDKAWPRKEIYAALAQELEGSTKVLPLMVGSEQQIIGLKKKLPLIADKVYKEWNDDSDSIAEDVKELLATRMAHNSP